MKKPNLFIVGQPRSGTYALHYFLSQHPEVFMSEDKEPLFFCKDFHEESDLFHKHRAFFRYRKESDYLSLFAAAKNEKFAGESSTHYLFSKVAAREILKFNPDAKIIMMLREPVSFLYSLYSQHFVRSQENVGDFETALSLEKERKSGRKIPPTVYCPRFLFYSERIKYYEQIVRYYDLFDKSNIKVIIFDDFKQQNDVIYKDVLGFLNVDADFVPVFDQVNVSKKPRFAKLNAWLLNSAFKKAIQNVIPTSLYSKIKPMGKKVLWRNQSRKPLDSSLRQKLMSEYKPEVVKISELLGIDLVKRWKYDQIV